MSFDVEIPDFSLLRELGAGGPAPVFLADQQGLDRQAVVRILRRDRSSSDSGSESDLAQPFECESRLLARVQHRNIVRIYQIGATDAVLFRAMEYLEGGSLLDRMRANDLTPAQAVNCCAQLARALHAFHALDAFHHDLRPSGILFRDARSPVLADLGMVRDSALEASDTATGISQRTPRYLSPEQLQGLPVDARSDVYALGLLLHFMLTGEYPGQGLGPVAADPERPAGRLRPLPDEVAGLQPVLERMLAGDPAQRYPDMVELQAALAAVVPLEGELSAESFDLPAAPRPRRKRWRALALAGAALLAAATFAAWLWLPRGLDDAQRQRVEQELLDFETYMVRMDIYGPAGANATDSLEQMLAITRQHPGVREAAERLAGVYLQDAHDSYLRGNFEDVLRLAEKALAFLPGHPDLGQLQAEAGQAVARERLEDLLAQGQAALARGRLLPPAAGNAFDLFSEARSLNPGHRAADSGLREIQLRLAELARTAWGAGDVQRAHDITLEGLALFPDSLLLNELLVDLEQAQTAD